MPRLRLDHKVTSLWAAKIGMLAAIQPSDQVVA